MALDVRLQVYKCNVCAVDGVCFIQVCKNAILKLVCPGVRLVHLSREQVQKVQYKWHIWHLLHGSGYSGRLQLEALLASSPRKENSETTIESRVELADPGRT